MITIFIPVLNEEAYIEQTVENTISAAKMAGKVRLEIIIADDASTDSTPEIIGRLEKKYRCIRSIHHQKNQGLGVSLQEAVRIARFPKFMIVPGDNDADVMLITRLIRARNKADLVLGFYLNKENRSRLRNFLSMMYGLIYMVTFNVYVQYINSPCVYTTKILKSFTIYSRRFSIAAEIVVKFLRSGSSLYEMPGLMQTGEFGSGSLKWHNFVEICITYIKLLYEIFWVNRKQYNKKYIRVLDKL